MIPVMVFLHPDSDPDHLEKYFVVVVPLPTYKLTTISILDFLSSATSFRLAFVDHSYPIFAVFLVHVVKQCKEVSDSFTSKKP